MSDETRKDQEAAVLWREARAAWSEVRSDGQPEQEGADALLLAAYLDGGLSEADSAGLEARLARDPALLDELMALKALEPVEPPTSLILRAQGLVREAPRTETAARKSAAGRSWFTGGFLQPLGWAGGLAALLVVCGLSFELGREGWTAASEIEGLAASVETPFDSATEFPL